MFDRKSLVYRNEMVIVAFDRLRSDSHVVLRRLQVKTALDFDMVFEHDTLGRPAVALIDRAVVLRKGPCREKVIPRLSELREKIKKNLVTKLGAECYARRLMRVQFGICSGSGRRCDQEDW